MSNKYNIDSCLCVALEQLTLTPFKALYQIPNDVPYKIYFILTTVDKKNFSIEYIGQTDENRNAQERLKNHEQLIKISSDIEGTNKRIYVLLFEISLINSLAYLAGTQFGASESYRETDDSYIKTITQSEHRLKSAIRLTEAALIKCFDPPYNKKLRNTEFPNKNSPSHQDYIKQEYNELQIVIPFDDISLRDVDGMSDKVFSTYRNTLKYPCNFLQYTIDTTQPNIFNIFKANKDDGVLDFLFNNLKG